MRNLQGENHLSNEGINLCCIGMFTTDNQNTVVLRGAIIFLFYSTTVSLRQFKFASLKSNKKLAKRLLKSLFRGDSRVLAEMSALNESFSITPLIITLFCIFPLSFKKNIFTGLLIIVQSKENLPLRLNTCVHVNDCI